MVEPYSWLIHAGFGRGAEPAELHKLFIDATSKAPLHWPTHSKYFAAVCEKWGGSHRQMFDFALESSKNAPNGDILHSLIPEAFNELFLAIDSEQGYTAACTKLRQPDYAKKVTAAL